MQQRANNPTLADLPTGYGRKLILNLLEVPQPVIAAVNGDAVGLGARPRNTVGECLGV